MTVTFTQKTMIAVILAMIGYAGNYFALPIADGVPLIFGSVFSVIAIVMLGIGWGVLVSVLAGSYTVLLWNHPYAMIIFAFEALWLGLALHRGHKNLVLIDAAYWLSLGLILIVVFYAGSMGLNAQSVLVIFLKQSINGLLNTLIASLFLYLPFIYKRCLYQSYITNAHSYKNMIFNTIAFFLMVPSLVLLVFDNHHEKIRLNAQGILNVQTETLQLESEITDWIAQHINAIQQVSQWANNQTSSALQQQQLARIKQLFPSFHNVYIANQDAITTAFHPPTDDKGNSNIGLSLKQATYFQALAEYLTALTTYGAPLTSDVFIGRGALDDSRLTIVSPVVKNNTLSHVALGTVNMASVQRSIVLHGLEHGLVITLLDGNNNVIISSDASKTPMSHMAALSGDISNTAVDDVYFHLPKAHRNMTVMKAWKKASYFSKTAIAQTNWTLHIEYPLAPMQAQLYAASIKGLLVVAILLLPLFFIAFLLSQLLIRPIQKLIDISADLPNQIDHNQAVDWPKSQISEVENLVTNFKISSVALGKKISTLSDRLLLATDSARIGVWDYNVTENTLVWDKWMYAMYGISEDEFGGAYEAWRNGLHPDDVAIGDEAIQKALQGEQEFHIEFRVVWPNGEVRHIKADAQVQRDKNGNALRMIGVNYDITERITATKALEAAVKKAEVANDAKSEFLANMSHEIRTPMNGVIGMTNLLLRTPLNDQQHEFASTVKSSAESLLSIINDILDFSKVEAGKLELEPLDFDIHQLIKQFSASMMFRIEEKGLLLTCPITTDDKFWLYGDSGRLRQILINLLGNAIKFTEKGEIKIHYHLEPKGHENTLLRVEIIDSGIGLTQAQQGALFSRFNQADGSTTRRYGGTGLGLAISKQLIELMGGQIGVTSQLGKGATFWFTVTLPNGSDTRASGSGISLFSGELIDAVKSDEKTRPLFKGKILVVEDNAINQMVAQCQLEELGVDVELAGHGQAALEKLETTAYDLVFMDCQMPVMDGFEASKVIRNPHSNVLNHAIPIIAMTANVIKGDREKCIAAGMNDYISKPVDPEKVAQALTRWLPPA